MCIRDSGKSEFKTPRPIANKSNMPSASLFQTGSGRRVNISTEKINAASKLLQSSEKIYNPEKDSAAFITPKLVKKKSKSRQKDDTSIQLKKMSTLKNKSGGKRKGFVTPRIIQKPGHAHKHKNDESHIRNYGYPCDRRLLMSMGGASGGGRERREESA